MTEREHEFHALWWRWGRYGNQDEHVHSCLTDHCGTVLVGAGRDCSPKDGTHHQMRWSSRNHAWTPVEPARSRVGVDPQEGSRD